MDIKEFVNSGNPWSNRGDDFNVGSDTGVFAFNQNYGSANVNGSFREYYYVKKELKSFKKSEKYLT